MAVCAAAVITGFRDRAGVALALLLLLAPSPAAALPPLPSGPPGFVVEDAFPLTTFSSPVQVVFLPDGRRLVVEKEGRVWVGTAAGGKLPAPLIDLSRRVLATGDRGLLSVAADPDFPSNRWLYFLYTVDPDSNAFDIEASAYARLERYRTSLSNPDVVDTTTREILIGTQWSTGIPFPSSELTHTIGTLRFGDDGTLLVSSGDAAHYGVTDAGGRDPGAFGAGRSPFSEDIGAFRALNVNSLCGKILRIDKETGLGLPSNPFWNGDPAANRSRVWAYGLRNPFRFALRKGTGSTNPADGDPGTLFVGDVGWSTWEEIDVVRQGGLNLGWPCAEGPVANTPYLNAPQPAGVRCDSIGLPANPSPLTAPPIWTRHFNGTVSNPHGWKGNAHVGGAFYTGTSYPAVWHGRLFVADYAEGWIRALDVDDQDDVYGAADFIDATPAVQNAPVDVETDPVSGDLHYVSITHNQVVRVRYVTGNHDPIAEATIAPSYGPSPLALQADASASSDPELQALSFLWHFGNGDSAVTAVASTTYEEDGVYTVSLEVRDPQGGVARRAFTVVVGQTPPPGTIVLPASGATFAQGEVVALEATPADPGPGTPVYRWDVDLAHESHFHLSSFILQGPSAQFVATVPDDGEEYRWRVRLTVTRGALTTRDTAFVVPRRNVAARDLAATPRSPRLDRPFVFTGRVVNVGGFDLPPVGWKVLDGATVVASGASPALPIGAAAAVTVALGPLPAGPHALSLIVDPANTIVETDETDGTAVLTTVVRLVTDPAIELRADRADGQAPFPDGGAQGPWSDLVDGYDAALTGFLPAESGWRGDGGVASPLRLELDGVDDRVTIAAPIPELAAPAGATAELWFRTGADVTAAQTVLDWSTPESAPPAGMAIGVASGVLRVRLDGWVPVALIEPSSWYHVVVSKGAAGARVSVNGKAVYHQAIANLGPPGDAIALGADAGALPTEPFGGALAIVRLYDTDLDDAQALVAFGRDDDAFAFTPPATGPGTLFALRADLSAGAAPHPVPGAGSPWADLAGGHGATLFGFDGTATSGWQGDGTHLDSRRLVFDGVDDRAAIDARDVRGLQIRTPLTATVWLRTDADVQTDQTVLEWVEDLAPPRRGLAVGIGGGALRVRLGSWVDVAPLSPLDWHSVAVAQTLDGVAVYLDGRLVLAGDGQRAGAQLSEISIGAGLGATAGTHERFFRGAIAEVGVRRSALDAATLRALYLSRATQYVHRVAFAPGICLPPGQCVELPVLLERYDPVGARSYSVDLRLDPGLSVCGAGFVEGSFLQRGGPTSFQATDHGGGQWTVDGAILSSPCGAPAGGELFRLHIVASPNAGAAGLEITGAQLRDCANAPLAAEPGAAPAIDHAPPPVVTDLVAARLAPADADGTRPVAVSFTLPPEAEAVEVYRAGFGNHPEYDDPPNPGTPPAAPSWPPPAPWQPVTLGPGGTDDHGARDFWYYVAFARDGCGNRSAASAVTPGVLNYTLGDVQAAAGDCHGDNAVGAGDLALLAGRYGAAIGPGDPEACLDIGPTTSGRTDARPATDDRLDFEDLMMLALTHDATAPPEGVLSGSDRVWVGMPQTIAAVGDSFAVQVLLQGTRTLHGVSVSLAWAAGRVAPGHVQAGALLAQQPLPSAVLSPAPGAVDAALLGSGPGLDGQGSIANVWFRVLAPGDPGIAVSGALGRDGLNQPVAIDAGSVPLAASDRETPGLWLARPAPDPFSSAVTIRYALPSRAPVRLDVHDVQGRRVRGLRGEVDEPGEHAVRWDGRDENGVALRSGLYFVRLETGGRVLRRSVRLVR